MFCILHVFCPQSLAYREPITQRTGCVKAATRGTMGQACTTDDKDCFGEATVNEFLSLDVNGNLAIATLRRPQRMNALSTPILDGLLAIVERLESDMNIRCLVITADGPSFCAGADLKERRTLGVDERWQYVEKINEVIRRLESAAVPVVAAINGFALGGGVELLLACDYRIAVATAKFGLPETALGIIPGGSQVRLLQQIGRSKMAWMTYTAARFSAPRALELGLIDEVVDDQEALIDASTRLALQIAANAPLALRAAKRLSSQLQLDYLREGMNVAEEVRGPLDNTQDCLEGLRAFQEKRAPVFVGR